MKRALLVFLSCALLALGLGGCSGKEDWAYIEDKGTLKVGITKFRPMNYDGADGELTGFETEFTKAVCDILGVKPEFQVIVWDTKINEVKSKTIDCVWNGMTITDTLKENLLISEPYMKNRQVLVAKTENVAALAASVEGKKIVAEVKSAGEAICKADEFLKKGAFTAVDSQTKGLMEVKSGTADGCVLDYVACLGAIGEGTDYADLVVVDKDLDQEEEQYGIAFRKNDKELAGKVNDAIKQLRANGRLEEIARKYKLEDYLIKE